MKRLLVVAMLVFLTVPVAARERTSRGTVTDIDPDTSMLVLQSDSGASRAYRFTDKTTFVDQSGHVVSRETIRNQPVTVTFAERGGRSVVSRVMVINPAGKPAGGTMERTPQ